MPRGLGICRDAIYRVLLFLLIFTTPLLSFAYNNDYSSSSYQDSYYQSWNSYKQQNSIKTENYVQQSWWSKTFTNVSNILANIGASINKALNNIGSFFTSAYNSIKNIFVKTPDIKTNIDTATPQIKSQYATKTDININSKTTAVNKVEIENNKYTTTNQNKKEPELAITAFARAINGEGDASRGDVYPLAQDGKIADTVARDIKQTSTIDQLKQIDQKDISIISPTQLKPADPGIMPAERWENVKSTQTVCDIEQKQNALNQATMLVKDTIQFTKADWKNNNNMVDSTGKGVLESFAREVNMNDTYTPIQQFFQLKSNQLNEVTVSALQGLDVAYNNPVTNNGVLNAVDKFSLATAKGCIVAGAMLSQGMLDVGKFGSEIPQIMASLVLAKDNFAAGDTKAGMRNIGNAIGGIGRESARATVIGSVGKSLVVGSREFLAKLSVGSIPKKDLVNFAGWSANKTVYKEGTVLYRLYDKNASGHWWTTQKPSSKLQWGIDQAVRPAWNSGERIATLRVPENKILVGWEGKASYQGDIYIGGGNQVYFKNVPDDWIVTDVFNK